MNHHYQRLACLTLWGALAVASPARAAEPNAIQAIDVADLDGGVELSIRGSRPPSYTVFKLQDPPRLVVDLAGADVSRLAGPIQVGRGGVLGVTSAQYKDDRSAVGRVIVALDGARRYEVAPRGDAVVVKVLPEATADAAPAPAPAAPAVAAAPPVQAAVAAAPAAPTAPTDNVVARRTDEAKVKKAAQAVTGVKAAGQGLVLATDGEVGTIEIIELTNPPRLALDLMGVAKAPRHPVKLDGAFGQARFGRDTGKVRVVLDVAGEMPGYDVKRVPGGIAVTPRAPAPAATTGATALAAAPAKAAPAPVEAPRPAPAPVKAPAAEPAPAPAAELALAAPPPAARASPKVKLTDLKFSAVGGGARIEIAGKSKYAISRPDPRTVVLTLEGAELVKKLERSLDTSAMGGPIMMVSSFNQPSTGQAKVVATLRAPVADALAETASGLAWTFSEPVAAVEAVRGDEAGRVEVASAAAFRPALEKAIRSKRPVVLDVYMKNAPVPTAGHWNIMDIYSPGKKVHHVSTGD